MGNQFKLAEIYRYENLEADLKQFEKQFADLVELETIGLSVEGRKFFGAINYQIHMSINFGH